MSGAPDPEYVAARRVLLDALLALDAHRNAIVLVGAQAVYIHTGAAEFAVAEYTTDADLAFDPEELGDRPLLEEAMNAAGFVKDEWNPGVWFGATGVQVDLLVPEEVGGGGRRAARLGPHGREVARKSRGLEGCLVDRAPHVIAALDPSDTRTFEVLVAGPAALLVAKAHKIADRRGETDRLADKDALDAFRLLRSTDADALATSVQGLRDDSISSVITREALDALADLFGTDEGEGCRMLARSVELVGDPEEVVASMVILTNDLLGAL